MTTATAMPTPSAQSGSPGGVSTLAGALPADLAHTPVFGILGVVLGAGIVTLAGRLLLSLIHI